MITSEQILAQLGKLETTNIRLLLNCEEYFELLGRPNSNVAHLDCTVYKGRIADIIKIFKNSAEQRKNFINILFKEMEKCNLQLVIWISIATALEQYQKDVDEANLQVEAWIKDTYIEYDKDRNGNVIAMYDTKIPFDDYVEQKYVNRSISFIDYLKQVCTHMLTFFKR